MSDEPLAITVQPQKRAHERAYEEAKPAVPELSDRLGAEDVATLVVNGSRFENWLSIAVTDVFRQTPRVFVATLAEPKQATSWATYQLRPGDRATLYLAGKKVCDGYLVSRKTDLDANNHVVTVQGASRDIDLRTAAAPAQYRGYKVDAICQALLRESGLPIQFRLVNPPASAGEPIRNFSTRHGESVWSAIERVCRKKNVLLRTDPDGNLVGGAIDQSAAEAASLVEGKNILSISATLNDEALMAKVYALGQDQGSDERFGKIVSEVAAQGANGIARPWLTQRYVSDSPLNPQEAKAAADFQMADALYTSVDVTVMVQGWRRPDGQLWQVTDKIRIEAPSAFPENGGRMILGLRAVTFAQSAAGTTTTLNLCLQSALGSPPDPNVKGEAPNLLEPQPEAAQPLSPP